MHILAVTFNELNPKPWVWVVLALAIAACGFYAFIRILEIVFGSRPRENRPVPLPATRRRLQPSDRPTALDRWLAEQGVPEEPLDGGSDKS